MEGKDKHQIPEERVTSTYAEIYFDDGYCDYQKANEVIHQNISEKDDVDIWTSPSDLLIGLIELKPPFTSKITRGKTHEGILAIGNDILEKKRKRFLKHLQELINDNDNGWLDILASEKKFVEKKVKKIYDDIFLTKSKIMREEISKFYEESLKRLERNVRSEVDVVLTSTCAGILGDLNFEIKEKLAKEKKILEDVLQKKYNNEVKKIKHYYKLLLDNELQRQNKLINNALHDRNDALFAFYKQVEAENITSTMYVMCAERKKCKIKQFLLENIQTTDVSEKMQRIKERQDVLDAFKKRDVKISEINQEWENKIKKVLQLFLKFISFSLKLLPEQTSFLLDLEKMMVLQIKEFQKKTEHASCILVDENEINNLFKFEEPMTKENVCQGEPFVIMGDLNDPTPPKYGSNETLATDVDLPYFRVQRQFVYAKCHKFEEIKAFLESQRCKCQDFKTTIKTIDEFKNDTPPSVPNSASPESVSSDEPLLIEDIQKLHDCPGRRCQDWAKINSFPYLNSYLDFTEENYERVKTILGKPAPSELPPKLIDPKQMVSAELPFAATKERYHTVQTQYSSQEDLNIADITCSCISGPKRTLLSQNKIKETESVDLRDLLQKHKHSLRNLIHENPRLLKMFTDECFDFIL